MNGVISDHARAEVQGMAPENMTSGQARRVLNRIDLETQIRRQGVEGALQSGANAQLPVISPHPSGVTPAAPAGGAGPKAPTALPDGLTLVN